MDGRATAGGGRARVVATALAAAGLVGACASPGVSSTTAPSDAAPTSVATSPSSATPVPSSLAPSPTSTTVTFTSERYGYAVEVPTYWTQTPATTDWRGTARLTDLSSALDRFDDGAAPGAIGHFLGLASQPVDGPAWLQEYTSANKAKFADVCPEDPHAWTAAQVHGDPGVSLLLDCPGAFVEYLFVHGKRAWIVTGSPDPVAVALDTLVIPD
jgi:hypothetical protein